MHYAIHGKTAAEVIVDRATIEKQHMGLTSWRNSPDGKILKSDVSVAKNYLSKDELDSMGRIVGAYLDLAEDRAKRKIPMTMEDWSTRLDRFLEMDDREILKDAGKITAQFAKNFAETEFEKYRVIQDRIFESDFDKLVKISNPAIEHKQIRPAKKMAIRGLRIKSEISQDQLAEITGIQRTNISGLENDRIEMTSHYAEMFSAVFKVHPSEILYPNGHVKKSADFLKLEKKADAFFKKVPAG
jgi:DNA-binding XRE family transcriptional regulator